MSDYKQDNETGAGETRAAVRKRDSHRYQMCGRLGPDRGGRPTLQGHHIERHPDDVATDDESGGTSRQWHPDSGAEQSDAAGIDSAEPACEDGTHVPETRTTASEAVDRGQRSEPKKVPEAVTDRPVDPLSPSLIRDRRDECRDGGQ